MQACKFASLQVSKFVGAGSAGAGWGGPRGAGRELGMAWQRLGGKAGGVGEAWEGGAGASPP